MCAIPIQDVNGKQTCGFPSPICLVSIQEMTEMNENAANKEVHVITCPFYPPAVVILYVWSPGWLHIKKTVF